MKVSVERLPESRVQLDIEVDEERLQQTLESTYRKVAAKARIAGFRPGKAPRQLVMQRIGGRPGLIREALDDLVPDAYNEAIATSDLDVIDQPDLEIIDIDPVRFKATVPVRPQVDLNDYSVVRVAAEPVTVTEDEVAEQILAMRRRLAIHAPVDRPVAWNDFLIADVKAEAEGDVFIDDEEVEFPLREGQTLVLPGLLEAFIGLEKGATSSIELAIPEDFGLERLRGKTAAVTLTVREIKEEELPEEDDDFAKEVSAEFETRDALRERIRKDLLDGREAAERNRVQTAAVDQLVQLATLDYPKLLVEREMDHMVSEGVGNDAANYQRYLQSIGRTHADFRETFREAAEKRVQRALVLNKLMEVEGITISDEDVDAEVARLAEPMGEEAGRFMDLFNTASSRDAIRRNLTTQRALERLETIARADGQAPATSTGPTAEGETSDAE